MARLHTSLGGMALACLVVGCGSTTREPAPVSNDTEEVPPSGCGLATGYAGDDACLLPPDPDVGDQFHYGPADHDDPAQIALYVLEPGAEIMDCQYMNSRNLAEVYYREFRNSLRPSSHHMLVNERATDIEDGFRGCSLEAGGARLIGGTTVARETIGGDKIIPENEGLAAKLPANAQVEMQLHYFNVGDEPLLREAWSNIYYKPADSVTEVTEPIQGYGNTGMAIPPGAHETWRSSMTTSHDLRLVDVYSHYHANTVRMTAWKIAADTGERTRLYESYEWEEPGVIPLNSVEQNPEPDPAAKSTGGISGIILLKAGDQLEWECEVQNGREVVLRFANLALDAEMCNLRGNYAPSWGAQWVGWVPGVKCDETNCPR